MSAPFYPANDREDMSPMAFFHKPEQDAMSERLKREARRAYAASITFMDEQVGRLLTALEANGLEEKTIIVFTSDHGYHMGEHHYWQKESLFEESTRVPLLISVPGAKHAGRRSPAICELIDIYPTLSDLCDLPAPAEVDGISLKPYIENPDHSGKPFALTQAVRYKGRRVSSSRQMDRDIHGYSIRTTKFRFTSWDQGKEGEELYDLSNDPRELTNVVENEEYRGTIKKMRKLLGELRNRK